MIIIIALESSVTRAQMRNKTESLIKFKSRRHTGVIISLRYRRLFKVEKQFLKDTFLDFYGKGQDFHNILMSLGVRSKCRV